MNKAIRSTAAVLVAQLANLMHCSVRDWAQISDYYNILLCDFSGEEIAAAGGKAHLVREIEDLEREVNSAGAAAEILVKALKELGAFNDKAESLYEMIWNRREESRRMASRADDMLYA